MYKYGGFGLYLRILHHGCDQDLHDPQTVDTGQASGLMYTWEYGS